ncbi:sigma-70 family RNA polymerase sigma factor [bacterium]|nr:sigma-70 family RNA polymerase sigma factor [bacterium]
MSHGDFPNTTWDTIRNAAAGRTTAATDFVTRYEPAVVRYARARRLDAQDAEDIAQEVFLRMFNDRVLERADRACGRFRCLLLSVTRHVLGHHFRRKGALKRGGGARALELDDAFLASIDAADVRDPEFDREWLRTILARALRRLKDENPAYHEVLHAFLVEERSHRAIASALGKTEAVVRNGISRGKAKLREFLRDEVQAYASSRTELEDELAYLSELLASRPGP